MQRATTWKIPLAIAIAKSTDDYFSLPRCSDLISSCMFHMGMLNMVATTQVSHRSFAVGSV